MPVTGTLIEGKYEIIAKIKEGGMGTIYKVRHRLLDEIRVVKVMRPQIGADEEPLDVGTAGTSRLSRCGAVARRDSSGAIERRRAPPLSGAHG